MGVLCRPRRIGSHIPADIPLAYTAPLRSIRANGDVCRRAVIHIELISAQICHLIFNTPSAFDI